MPVINTKPSKRNAPSLPGARFVRRRRKNTEPSSNEVTALQWSGDRQEMSRFCGRHIVQKTFSNRALTIATATGDIEPKIGEWVVKLADGTLELWAEDNFKRVFKPV